MCTHVAMMRYSHVREGQTLFFPCLHLPSCIKFQEIPIGISQREVNHTPTFLRGFLYILHSGYAKLLYERIQVTCRLEFEMENLSGGCLEQSQASRTN